jgi:hypothetical protein
MMEKVNEDIFPALLLEALSIILKKSVRFDHQE